MASVRKRFIFTLGASLFRGVLGFIAGMLLARWLGPSTYGNMTFLFGTFLGLRQLLDMGSSMAFFTFMSQRPQSRRFIWSFFFWLALQFLVTACVIGVLLPSQWIETIWHGEQRGLVLMAFVAVFMQNSIWPVIQQAGESQRQTVWVQGISVAIAAVHLLAVALLWGFGALGLYAILTAIAVEYLLAAVVAQRMYSYAPESDQGADADSPAPLLRKYLNYCLPLVIYSWVSFAYTFADRWLLQKYGGGVEQAYYAVGAQFASVALIATSSILRIFWKEIAEAHHNGDLTRAREIYQKVSRLLFLVGAVIAGFLIPWAESLLRNILGAAYAGGATTMAVMFLYPVHQSMGQIGSTMLYATERVALQVWTGIIFMILSIGVTYVVLASPDAALPGLGWASEGLALKMVVLQILSVNTVGYLIARIWKWRFDWIYQPVSLLGCAGLGWVAHIVVNRLFGDAWPLPVPLLLGGGLYLVLVAALVYWMPWLAGVTRAELVSDVGGLVQNTKTMLFADVENS